MKVINMHSENSIESIQNAFSNGCPNGALLGWDANRFYESLTKLFYEFSISNETDFNYSYCNSYDIAVGNGEQGENFVITVKISFIIDAYRMQLTEYSKDKKSGKVIDFEDLNEGTRFAENVRSFFEDRGFTEVADEELTHIVENVHLELADLATVGKCLFDDYE